MNQSFKNCIFELREKGEQPIVVKLNEENHKKFSQFIKKVDEKVSVDAVANSILLIALLFLYRTPIRFQ